MVFLFQAAVKRSSMFFLCVLCTCSGPFLSSWDQTNLDLSTMIFKKDPRSMLLQYSKGTWPWKIMDYASFRSIWCNDFWFPCWTCVFPSHFFATGNMIIMIGLAGSYQWLPVESLLNQWVTHDNLIKQPLDQRHIFSQCHGFIWIVRVNHHQWIMYIYILSYWLLYNNISRTLTMTVYNIL